MLIAFFGGLALIIAKTKKENISSAIFGVAIATALMPPLCTAGYYLANTNLENAVGAMYLFIINSIYITIATYLVLKFLRFPLVNYSNASNRKTINRLVTSVSLLIMIPAVITFINVIKENNFENQSQLFLKNELQGLPNYDFLVQTAVTDFENNKEITINNYGQKPISEEVISILKNKLKNYKALEDAKFIFKQQNIDENSNLFIQELRLRDSLELAEKNKKLNELSKEIEELKELSREKLIFNEISKEASLIYPDLKQFEIFEKIRTDFNSTKKILVVSVVWDSLLLKSETEKLNLSIRRWLEFQLDSKDFIIENN